jgi:predicted transposase YdaD
MLTIDVEKLATYRIAFEIGMERGRKRGAHKASVAAATKLLEMKLLNVAEIAKATDLSLSEVQDIAEKVADINNS